MDENAALARLRRGDERALEWFVKRYTPYVGAIVWSIMGGHLTVQDAEEVTADVFLTLWRSREKPRPGSVDMLAREDREELLAAVDALGEPDREIFLRRYWLGQAAPDIGRRLGMKAEAVRQRLKRGRDAIKVMLTKGA